MALPGLPSWRRIRADHAPHVIGAEYRKVFDLIQGGRTRVEGCLDRAVATEAACALVSETYVPLYVRLAGASRDVLVPHVGPLSEVGEYPYGYRQYKVSAGGWRGFGCVCWRRR